jgi:hypothetical protein
VGQDRYGAEAVVEVGEDVGYGVLVGDLDEVGVGVDAVVEAVDVDEVDRLGLVVLEFGYLEGA